MASALPGDLITWMQAPGALPSSAGRPGAWSTAAPCRHVTRYHQPMQCCHGRVLVRKQEGDAGSITWQLGSTAMLKQERPVGLAGVCWDQGWGGRQHWAASWTVPAECALGGAKKRLALIHVPVIWDASMAFAEHRSILCLRPCLCLYFKRLFQAKHVKREHLNRKGLIFLPLINFGFCFLVANYWRFQHKSFAC